MKPETDGKCGQAAGKMSRTAVLTMSTGSIDLFNTCCWKSAFQDQLTSLRFREYLEALNDRWLKEPPFDDENSIILGQELVKLFEALVEQDTKSSVCRLYEIEELINQIPFLQKRCGNVGQKRRQQDPLEFIDQVIVRTMDRFLEGQVIYLMQRLVCTACGTGRSTK
jgi:hypothetical protein